MANKPVTGLTTWGGATQGSTADLDDNFAALQDAINDFNTYSNYLIDGGAANAYTASLGANLTGALTDGLIVQLRVTNTNTGASTFAYDGGAAVTIKNAVGGALIGGEMVATSIVQLQYSTAAGPAWILQTGGVNQAATTWTPVLTFATPGDLSVTYSTQSGFYTKTGKLVVVTFSIVTSAFTHTTAAGNCQITGLPFTSLNTAGSDSVGPLQWQGVTKANYTDAVCHLQPNSTILIFPFSGSAQSTSNLASTDMPTGGSVVLRGTLSYRSST